MIRRRGTGTAQHAGLATLAGRAQRWASAGVILVVVGVCGLGLISAHRLSAATASANRTVGLSDDYQKARFHATSAGDRYRAYLSAPSESLRLAKAEAFRQLSVVLAALELAPGTDLVALERLEAETARYSQATERVETVLDGVAPADAYEALPVAETRIADESEATLTLDLGTLAELTHVASQHHLADAAAQARLLNRGAPVVLAASLVFAFLLGSVLRRHRRAVVALASTDALTQLPNRLALAAKAAEVLDCHDATGSGPSLLLLDLDRFKEVNDSLGHHYGDELLVQVSRRLRAAVKGTDLVARLGGDEFAILLSAGGEDAARVVANRVKTVLETPFIVNTLSIEVGVSIGMAVATPTCSDVTALLRCADVAMYVAKDTHEGHVVYTAEHDLHTADKVRLMSELRHALSTDALVVHYQPKVALGDGRLLGVEALVRWQHPVRGLLQPSAFIPAVEDSELMDRVTSDVLTKALRQVTTWSQQGLTVPVAVNIPTRSLLNLAFPTQVETLLAASGVAAGLLSLEITESSAMRDPQRCVGVLEALRAIGVKISIDDYGTGYASMSYLKDLPVDELKIDRSFVAGMLDDPQSEILARSIIELGHNLGLTVVGEGVEDESVAAVLRDAGCDIAQGYHYARPMPGSDLAAWDQTRRDSSTIPTPRQEVARHAS
jgi:diguanylate cyclase (GGDEF)-like protein